MAYVINRYDGQAITSVEDGTIDQTLDIKLIGKNYAGYGEIQNENFLHMLESFANSSPPPRAIRGQIWYDTVAKKIKFFTGDTVGGVKIFKTAGGVEYGNEPSNPTEGDLWLDRISNQLKVRIEGNQWLTVGPQTAGTGTTQLVSQQVKAQDGTLKSIIAATINNNVVYIISNDDFILDATENNIEGFTGLVQVPGASGTEPRRIKKGITLAYANSQGTTGTGVTGAGTSHVFWGTASSSESLVDASGNRVSAADVISLTEGTVSGILNFTPDGFTIKNNTNDVLKGFIEVNVDPNAPIFENLTGPRIVFRVRDGASVREVGVFNANRFEPGVDNAFTLGTALRRWSNVHATTFTGTATQAATLQVGVDSGTGNPIFRLASTAGTANTIACRDGSGSLTASIFSGTATSARYADLAEKYLADKEYEAGTVMTVGGEAEVRASMFGDRAIGVVSTAPAYMMNSDLEGGTYVALKGRVPCKVIGSIKKGDRLVASDNGYAIHASFHQHPDVFGIALESNSDVGVKTIEVLVL
jgi:hypothetical protein